MKTFISTRGQLALPGKLLQDDRIDPGQEFGIERLGPGVYVFFVIGPAPSRGLVDWLVACPEKGWFEPVPSESTGDL